MIEKDLQKIGFSDKEAKIYLILAKNGELSAGKIANKTDLPRATVYSCLEKLIKNGLISTALSGRIKYFSIEPPVAMDNLLKKKEDQLKKQREMWSLLNKEVKRLQRDIDRPEINFYEGINAVRSLFKSTASQGKHIFEIGDWDVFGDYANEFSKMRIVNNTTIDLVTKDSDRAKKERLSDKKMLRKQHFIKDKDIDIPAMIAVGDDHLAIFTLNKEHPIGIKIRNKKIIKTFKSLFKLAVRGTRV